MNINTGKLKDPYVSLRLADNTVIVVKLEVEGVVVDHFESDESEVIDSTYKFYYEMEEGGD
jgi:hypothetical protein